MLAFYLKVARIAATETKCDQCVLYNMDLWLLICKIKGPAKTLFVINTNDWNC